MIDDVIMGNVLGAGGNLARLSALKTGLSIQIPGLTIDRQCGSGINAINLAASAIRAGDGDIFIAGGIESYSQAPYLLAKQKRLYSFEPPKFLSNKVSTREIGDPPMGITAENLAEKYHISREEQDQFALSSQMKMAQAIEEKRFEEQIVPIKVSKGRGQETVFEVDEHPRPQTTMEGLTKLAPAFLKEERLQPEIVLA